MFVWMGGKQKLFQWLLVLFSPLITKAQNSETSFRFPLDTPAYLSGTFGEFRGSHFHAGIDIKTFGQEGLEVLSAEDGYVSRIKISPYGYGKAIYITHNNGYTTVYGHLSHFAPEIEAYVRRQQYAKRSFSIELFPKKTQFRVRKGKLIAYSGNTGGSAAPHLHFEIRDSKTQDILNPLRFDLGIPDTVSPQALSGFLMKRDRSYRMENGLYPEFGRFDLSEQDTVQLRVPEGTYGLAIAAKDFLNEDTSNVLGVYGIEIWKGQQKLYVRQFDRFSFSDAHYIDLLSTYIKGYPPVEYCFKEYWISHGLSQYLDDGWIAVQNKQTDTLQLRLYDEKGNSTSKVLLLKGLPSKQINEPEMPADFGELVFKQAHTFTPSAGYAVDFFAGSFFDSTLVKVQLKAGETDTLILAPLDHFAHERYRIIFPLTEEQMKSPEKWCITRLEEDGSLAYVGSQQAGAQVSAKTKAFGRFFLVKDEEAPTIGDIRVEASRIQIPIQDNFSGINRYTGTLDNRWFLLEYDPKTNLLTGDLSEFKSGEKLEFKLTVKDNTENSSEIIQSIQIP